MKRSIMTDTIQSPQNHEAERLEMFMQLLHVCDDLASGSRLEDEVPGERRIIDLDEGAIYTRKLGTVALDDVGREADEELPHKPTSIVLPQEGITLHVQIFNEEEAALMNDGRLVPPVLDLHTLGVIEFEKTKDDATIEGLIFLLEGGFVAHETQIRFSDTMDMREFEAFAKRMGLERSWNRQVLMAKNDYPEVPYEEDPDAYAEAAYDAAKYRDKDVQRLYKYLSKIHKELQEVQQG